MWQEAATTRRCSALLCMLSAPADLANLSVRLPHVRAWLALGVGYAVAQVGALRIDCGSGSRIPVLQSTAQALKRAANEQFQSVPQP